MATVVPILTLATRAAGIGASGAEPEEAADAVERGVGVLARVLREELRPVQPPLRIARDDVGEGAAAVDPEIPGRHGARPPVPPDSRPTGAAAWRTAGAEAGLCAAAGAASLAPHVDLDPHHRGDRRASSPGARACSPSSSAGGGRRRASPSPSPSSASGPRWRRPTASSAPPRSRRSARSSASRAEDEAAAARVFNLARQDVAGFEAYAARIAGMFRDRPRVLEDILEGLFHVALADGRYHEGEEEFLNIVARLLRRPAASLRRASRRGIWRAAGGDPWAVLGLPRDADFATARARWRELVRAHHPDKMIARGLPPETVNLGNARLAADQPRLGGDLRAAAARRGRRGPPDTRGVHACPCVTLELCT